MKAEEKEQVYCANDKCKAFFDLPANTHDRQHKKLIVETYIKCPECGTETTAFVTDVEARKEQAVIKKMRERWMKKRQKLAVRMAKLKEELEQEKGKDDTQ